jgi:hypothetical protein
MSGRVMHKVRFRFHNSPQRRFLPFQMHKVTPQQFYSDRKSILLIKSVRKNHVESIALSSLSGATGFCISPASGVCSHYWLSVSRPDNGMLCLNGRAVTLQHTIQIRHHVFTIVRATSASSEPSSGTRVLNGRIGSMGTDASCWRSTSAVPVL